MFQLAHRIGGPAGLLTALAVTVVAAASASAAPSNSVSISGPHSVQAGAKVKLRFTGYAASDAPSLRVWLDNRKCATTAKAEGARPELRSPTSFSVTGNFKAVLTIGKSSPGTHLACAYLVDQGAQNTAARASWRYVTH